MAMSSVVNTGLGSVTIIDEVVAKTAGLAAVECYGIVGMAAKNARDGFMRLLKKESLTKGIRVTQDSGSVCIELRIIVEYGTNIIAIGESAIDSIKYHVEESTGVTVSSIDIFVVGIRRSK